MADVCRHRHRDKVLTLTQSHLHPENRSCTQWTCVSMERTCLAVRSAVRYLISRSASQNRGESSVRMCVCVFYYLKLKLFR